MAFPGFSISDAYASLIAAMNSRLQEVGKLFSGVTTSGNEFTGQVRYNGTTKRLEVWSGSAWGVLDMSGTGIAAATDADTLDGQHGAYYRDAANMSAGSLPLDRLPTNLTGKNADKLDNQEGSYYLDLANSTGALPATAVTNIPVRQTVLNAAVDAAGNASFITTGSGLAPLIQSTAVNVTIAFSAGFAAAGALDYIGTLNNDEAVTVASNTTSYIYANRATDTGQLSLGATTLPPVYQYQAPSHSSGLHWFDLSGYVMRVSNGTSWAVVQRVFLGQATAGASTITSVISYALRRYYRSEIFSVLGNTNYTKNHNLGFVPHDVKLFASDVNGAGLCQMHELTYYNGSTYYYGAGIYDLTRLAVSMDSMAHGAYSFNGDHQAGTTINYAIFIVNGGW